MNKIRILTDDGITIETKMPFIPKIGETIGFWCGNNDWKVGEIMSIVHEFDKKDKYIFTELSVDVPFNELI